MQTWPNIQQPVWPISEDLEDVALQSPAENGLVVTRAKFTRQRVTFTLQWTALSTSDYSKLKEFYKQMLGGSKSFSWTHPVSHITYEVRFNGKLTFDNDGPNLWSGSIKLSEV